MCALTCGPTCYAFREATVSDGATQSLWCKASWRYDEYYGNINKQNIYYTRYEYISHRWAGTQKGASRLVLNQC